ncbi:ABC transporter permease [Candidatus Izemoplasma sp. B36]|uniref:ABC transporter permease n=1 Tax=Candidatus Izemoplasma sp. B36 TaxID=3242468 RepID=UPI003556441A
MRNYYIKRILSAILTLFIIATVTFFMMKLMPGGPFARERPIQPEIIELLEEKYNLNDPIFVQYYKYMLGIIKFDFGYSYRELGVNVTEQILLKFPISLRLGLYATIAIIVLGIPIGIVSALRENTWVDHLAMFLATIGVTIPSFVVAVVYISLVAGQLGWVDAFGLDEWTSYIGPVLALAAYSLSFVSRLTRSSMLEVLRQDYMRTARANGLPKVKVLYKHALKNALIPVVTYIGPMFASIITGSFVVERVFSIGGIGKYYVESVSNRDYTMIMAVTVFYAAIYIFMVFLVDIAYSWIDPRIKLGKTSGE